MGQKMRWYKIAWNIWYDELNISIQTLPFDFSSKSTDTNHIAAFYHCNIVSAMFRLSFYGIVYLEEILQCIAVMCQKLFCLCSLMTDRIVSECKERQDFTIQIHFISIANRHYSRDFSSFSVTRRGQFHIMTFLSVSNNWKNDYELVRKI